jgi:hypothetical protein
VCRGAKLLSASLTATAPLSMTIIVPFRTDPPPPFPPPLSSAIATPEAGITARSSFPGLLGDVIASGSPLGRNRPTETSKMPADSPPALLDMHLRSERGESGNRPVVHERACKRYRMPQSTLMRGQGNELLHRCTRTAQREREGEGEGEGGGWLTLLWP